MYTYNGENKPMKYRSREEIAESAGYKKLLETIEGMDIPESRIRFAHYMAVGGLVLVEEFDDNDLSKAVGFVADQEIDPRIRNLHWFLGIGTGENGKNEICVHMPWNCTKYEIAMVNAEFDTIFKVGEGL